MSDYISRETAKDFFINMDAGNSRGYATLLTPEEFAEYLDELPAADVEPVRRVTPIRCGMDEYYGEWVRFPNCDFDLNTSAAKFCGGCGAKMNLEE